MAAIQFALIGGPDVLTIHESRIPTPGPGEILIRQTAIGLNFIDTYHRTGLYPVPLPSGIGLEAAGVVETVGPGVTLTPGTRIGYCWGPIGAYASHRVIAADRVVVLPDGVGDEAAAAGLLKGCTTEFLVERCARIQPGQWVLVQAAAGGVGLLLVQWLKHVGANVIAVAGSPEKVAMALAHGADHGIVFAGDLAAQVRALTDGRGVDVVFDGVGKTTFEASLDSLCRRGLHISYGNASGAVGPVDFSILARKGSLFVTRPTLFDYYTSRAEIETHAGRVLELIASGVLKVNIDQRYALKDAAQAHRDLEARKTTGSTILIP
ncbi:quinone oxidoreductase [Polymorphobacter glacialis]|uniref:Quinone oxidoreductase n=1 Tax=Sandarakinorhabdus glacialis TaxID=1614636 RepID=A0A916ZR59_9SPHN|nr:quinone oxidoreductase [Polymorphobacter glacialis]GGE08728.1 quinone oxidoreductase [Polymorphobacter glacialis]